MRKYHLHLIAILPIIILGCGKDKGIGNPDTALKGFKDSLFVFNVQYKNNKISAVSLSATPLWSFEYKENYVRAYADPLNIEYFLNNHHLPVRISRNYDGSTTSEVLFYYKQGTIILDSVIETHALGLGYPAAKSKYTFSYNAGNIEQVIHRSFNHDGTTTADTCTYTYSSTPNIFRTTHPLLYIYTNPGTQLVFNNRVFYFPKIFSASTLNTFSIPDFSRRIQGKLNYMTTANGKLAAEWYDGYGYRYEFYYK